jgi:hypothetical protein
VFLFFGKPRARPSGLFEKKIFFRRPPPAEHAGQKFRPLLTTRNMASRRARSASKVDGVGAAPVAVAATAATSAHGTLRRRPDESAERADARSSITSMWIRLVSFEFRDVDSPARVASAARRPWSCAIFSSPSTLPPSPPRRLCSASSSSFASLRGRAESPTGR